MTDYTAKNELRKTAAFKENSKARAKRRQLDGAFGNLKGAAFNDLVAGTNGVEKSE